MQLVLLGAAVVSMVALQEFSTGVVIIGLTVLNAVLGLNQEGKAAESVAALQKMLVIRAVYSAHYARPFRDAEEREKVRNSLAAIGFGNSAVDQPVDQRPV